MESADSQSKEHGGLEANRAYRRRLVLGALTAAASIVPAVLRFLAPSTQSGPSGPPAGSGHVTTVPSAAPAESGAGHGPLIQVFTIAPLIAAAGDEVSLRWKVLNAAHLRLMPSGMRLAESEGEIRLKPTASLTYELIATGVDGATATRSATFTLTHESPARPDEAKQRATIALEEIEPIEIDGRGEERWRFELYVGDTLAIHIPELAYHRGRVVPASIWNRQGPRSFRFAVDESKPVTISLKGFKKNRLQVEGAAEITGRVVEESVLIPLRNRTDGTRGNFIVRLSLTHDAKKE